MIDLKDLRENPDKYRKGASDKQYDVHIDALLSLDEQVRAAQTELQSLTAERNQLAKQIGPLMGKIKKAEEAEKQKILQEVDALKAKSEESKGKEESLCLDLEEIYLTEMEIY